MLSDVKEVVIKSGALELAAALNDVLSIWKNPTDAFKQLNEKHIVLQKTLSDYSNAVSENQRILSEHKESRVKQSVENQKNQQVLDDKTKTLKDLEKNIAARETSAKVRETALNTKDKQLGEKNAALVEKEHKLASKETALAEREAAVKAKGVQLDKQLGELQSKHDKLKEAIG